MYKNLYMVSQETWNSIPHPRTRTRFYFGNPVQPNTPDTSYFPYDDNLANLGRITLGAYEQALQEPDWDFIARVNASCYVHKRLLADYVDTKPDHGVLCGLIADSGLGFPYLWGGGQYIISRDVVEKLVAGKDKWNHRMMEDGAVSKLALDLEIPVDGKGRACSINAVEDGYLCIAYRDGEQGGFRFKTYEEFAEQNDQFFIRVKHDPNRAEDLVRMRSLFQTLTP